MKRLFFALWPTEVMRAQLLAATSALRAALADARCVPPGNWHLTLAFLGSVAASALDSVTSVAQVVAGRARSGAPVEVRLGRAEFWPKPQLVCATAPAASAGAEALAGALRDALLAAGFAPDLKPFRAHVTLARQLPRSPGALELTPITWTFTEFALIESRTAPSGPLYSVLGSWRLDSR